MRQIVSLLAPRTVKSPAFEKERRQSPFSFFSSHTYALLSITPTFSCAAVPYPGICYPCIACSRPSLRAKLPGLLNTLKHFLSRKRSPRLAAPTFQLRVAEVAARSPQTCAPGIYPPGSGAAQGESTPAAPPSERASERASARCAGGSRSLRSPRLPAPTRKEEGGGSSNWPCCG